MPFLSAESGNIYYEIRGKGEPLVLLHGLSRSGRHWREFASVAAVHYKVITLDSRGLGRSEAAMTWMTGVDDLAKDVSALAEHLGLGSFHLLGISMGGMVALSVAANPLANLKSLTLVNSSVGGWGQLRVFPKALSHIFAMSAFQKGRHKKLFDFCVSDLASASSEEKERVYAKWCEIEKEEGLPVVVTMKQAVAALRFRGQDFGPLLRRKVPINIVCGENDKFVPNINSGILHQLLPGSKFFQIPNAGHELSVNFGRQLLDVLLANK